MPWIYDTSDDDSSFSVADRQLKEGGPYTEKQVRDGISRAISVAERQYFEGILAKMPKKKG